MRSTRCDKCKEHSDGEPIAIVTVAASEGVGGRNSERAYELCAPCLDKHRRFMTYIDEPCVACDAPAVPPVLSSIDVPFGGSRYDG